MVNIFEKDKGKSYFCRKEKNMENVSGLKILLIFSIVIALLTGIIYILYILNKEVSSDTDMEKEISYMKWQINMLIALSIINGTAILLLAMRQLSLS
ncbi:hypothetical protein DW107_07465 [Tannerella sp. AM09-19]|jgi:flagellar basal body-associated protein FliL|nr:hypothetical protein DW107_07465 [Tannerella sp. AM09-19]